MPAASATDPTALVRKVPNRRMTRPASAAASSAPVGKATTTSPNSLLLSAKAALISG